MSEIQSRGPGTTPARANRGLQPMRDVLRANLGRSLSGLGNEGRLAAAWTVACGRALASHGAVIGYDNAVVRVEVEEGLWLAHMISIRGILARQMAEASGLPVHTLEFAPRRREVR